MKNNRGAILSPYQIKDVAKRDLPELPGVIVLKVPLETVLNSQELLQHNLNHAIAQTLEAKERAGLIPEMPFYFFLIEKAGLISDNPTVKSALVVYHPKTRRVEVWSPQ